MVEKSVKSSSKNTTPVEITSTQALASRPIARNLKACGRKGGFPSRQSDLAEDLSDISDAEVASSLNTKKESHLMKIAWEMMNSDYQKGKQRKPITKKKDTINKTAPSKQTSAARTESNAESEKKKRLGSYINYDVLDKLFEDENSPKRAKLVEPVIVGDKKENSQQISEECLLERQGSEEEEEEEEANRNEDYNDEDGYGGVEECYGEDADLDFEDQDEGEDNEDIIW